MRESRRDKGVSPSARRWGTGDPARYGAAPPPTESVFFFRVHDPVEPSGFAASGIRFVVFLPYSRQTMTMTKRRLPIGTSSFRTIRKDDCYYVDKTIHIHQLVNEGYYYFLSRPRRFGKSLLISTLKELFEGDRELFQGLYIHDRWDWDTRHPVVRLSFGGQFNQPGILEKDIIEQLESAEHYHGLEPAVKSDTGARRLRSVIERLYRKFGQPVVVLVDEYDKPILDALENRQQAQANRDYLRGFYGIIKDCADYIRFVFVTGISMYSKVSLFSNLNNLNDISLDAEYATICGYTDEDLRTVFEPELVRVEKEERQEIQRWYNGYHWRGKEKVYNPFDIMLYFQKREFQPYWYETGTPTWLYHLMKRGELSTRELKNLEMYKGDLSTFDLEKVNLNALLFQCGYLTIVGEQVRDGDVYFTLDYPNREVRVSLNRELMAAVSGTSTTEVLKRGRTLVRLLVDNDFSGLQEELKALFAGIPYSFAPPLRGSRRDTGASPQSLRWGDVEAVGSGASRPPTESAVAFGSASSTPPQGGSDSAYGSASSAAHHGGSDGGLSPSLTTAQEGSDVGVARYEGYYASILYAIFSTLNLDIRVEEASVRGRSDIVVMYQKQVFVFELKVTDGVDRARPFSCWACHCHVPSNRALKSMDC